MVANMGYFKIYALFLFGFLCTSLSTAGISPVHDLREKINSKLIGERFLSKTPHKVLNHLDNTILKATRNVTQNSQMEDTLYQISKDLISTILSKIEIQDKITRITREALEAPGKNKGITAIETRRILDYISRTLSGHMLSITKVSTEPELHRLVYGLAQIAAEVSIVSALKDITYATALSKKQSVDLSLRKKRSAVINSSENKFTTVPPLTDFTVYSAILNKSISRNTDTKKNNTIPTAKGQMISPYSVLSGNDKKIVRFLNTKITPPSAKGFLNQTVLDMENIERNENVTDPAIILDKTINATHYITQDSQTLDTQEFNAPGLTDDWFDQRDSQFKTALNSEIAGEMETDQPDLPDDATNEKERAKVKLEKLEVKAKKAILYAGDVAYLTAASVVALRRALTASIEVQMSVKYAKNGMSNHQDLMMNLAKTAAQQAGKEARIATSKSLACERVIKLALKYTAQSYGADLNHVANRIVMDSLSLSTLAKSMAFVSSDIAINSLYQATDVKPPS